MDRAEKLEIINLLEEKRRREDGRSFFLHTLYPDEGPLRRELYSKHMQFFAAGTIHQERATVSANRIGKSMGIGAYESALHLTGLYPDWWPGRRFEHAVDWWAASNTAETTRDICQREFLGPLGAMGTGMIPKHLIIGDPTHRRGVAGAIDTVRIEHVSGDVSQLAFKSYDQGREKFQGTAKHGIWFDEECDEEIYFEALSRLMTTSGMMIATFTPLLGLSKIVLRFLPNLAMKETA